MAIYIASTIHYDLRVGDILDIRYKNNKIRKVCTEPDWHEENMRAFHGRFIRGKT